MDVEGDADAVGAAAGLMSFGRARHDENLDVAAIEIAAGYIHALAIAPVQTVRPFVEHELFRRRNSAGRNNRDDVATVQVATLDRAVLRLGVLAHVGPEDVAVT